MCTVDVLVLDDASPLPGLSREVELLCGELGFAYYRSPRNLGIPRNFNLALLRALRDGYDFVVLANSDVIFAERLVDQLLAGLTSEPSIASVTAWSNNASIYSLPNADPDRFIADQAMVDWLGSAIGREFGHAVVDIPVGVGFCMCISVQVLAKVGLMDPVFGRGYCEENDWCLRSKALGFRIGLVPAAFAYHRGRASTAAAGILEVGATTVPANERILDLRYPLYRSQVDAYIHSDIPDMLIGNGLRRIVIEAAREFGYDVTVGHVRGREAGAVRPRIAIEAHVDLAAYGLFRGFAADMRFAGADVLQAVIAEIGAEPVEIRVYDQRMLRRMLGIPVLGREMVTEVGYPPRV